MITTSATLVQLRRFVAGFTGEIWSQLEIALAELSAAQATLESERAIRRASVDYERLAGDRARAELVAVTAERDRLRVLILDHARACDEAEAFASVMPADAHGMGVLLHAEGETYEAMVRAAESSK